MILVCGATGTIGSELIRRFSSSAKPVRALMRRPASEKAPLPAGVEEAIGDLAKPETLSQALRGVDKVFLLSANGDGQAAQEKNLIEAASKSGVAHIVKLSVMGAETGAPFEFGRLHGRIEEALKSSGMEWTILRPNMMMQNLRWYRDAIAQGVLPMPLGNAAVSHVDAGDIAHVAFHALTEPGHAGRTYTLTGPEALTGEQVAAILASAIQKPVAFQSIPMEQFRAFLEKTEDSKYVLDAECELFETWSEGAGSAVNVTIQDVTGAKPKSLAEFAAEHAAEFA